MRYVKMLGLLAVAAAALTVMASTASATLTSPAGTVLATGSTFHVSSEGAVSGTGTITIVCAKATVNGEVTSNETKSASGPVTSLSFTECGNHTVTVTQKGSFTINSSNQVFSTGAQVTVLLHSIFLGTVHCIYTTSGTDVGEFTGGTPAKVDTVSKSIPRTATDGACGEHSTAEGTFKGSGTLLND